MRSPPRIDDGARRRLTARFGPGVGAWLHKLPAVLSALAERWQMEFDSLIPRGSMSVVIRCRMADGRPAVLKISQCRRSDDHAVASATRAEVEKRQEAIRQAEAAWAEALHANLAIGTAGASVRTPQETLRPGRR